MEPIDRKPYLDDDLLEIRVRQREQLAAIPSWLLDRTVPRKDVALPESDAERRVAERVIRDHADKYLDHLNDEFEIFADTLKAQAGGRLMQSLWDENTRQVSGAIGNTADKLLREHRAIQEIPTEDAPKYKALVPLLSLADQLAGDYEDPRVVEARNLE